MARGKKTSPEVIYAVMTSWACTKNYKETAAMLGLPVSTVKKIVEDHKDDDEFVKLCKEKEAEFSETASRIIGKALRRLENDIDNDKKNIPINHLTTVIGTLYDKKALCDGKPTGITDITFKLPEDVEKYAR